MMIFQFLGKTSKNDDFQSLTKCDFKEKKIKKLLKYI